MKKLLTIIMSLLVLTGCSFAEEEISDITYTTYYPYVYATNYMLNGIENVLSIYPSGVDTTTYELTKKQKENYSNSHTFIYTGLNDEVKLAVEFLNNNSSLNLIDATHGLNYSTSIAELWLNPSNYLMIARNIKSTLIDYESNIYNREKISDRYDELKILISELDVELTMISKNASKNNILIADDTLAFLSKYNLNVLSLNPKNENYSKSYSDAKKLIANGEIKYIYAIKGTSLSDEINTFIAENNIEKVEINPMYTISEEERKNNDSYYTIMKENIDKLKLELLK